jgi:DNA-binding winged helix-turn-helix (wHTH) protein/Tol biopolymer transport system component
MRLPEGYQFGPFQIDMNERACRRGDEFIPLTGKAFDLLLFLVRDPGRTHTKNDLMAALWTDTVVEEKNLTQTIFLLRKALGDDSERPVYIQTVARLGYKFVAPVTTAGPPQAIPANERSRRWRWLAAAAVVFGALAAGWTVRHFLRPHPLEQLAFRLQIEPPEGGRFVFGLPQDSGVALSPDGKTAAYVVERGGKRELWIRPLDAADARPLPGTDLAAMPFWSPDNRSVAFFSSSPSGKKLWRIELAGGVAVPICDVRGTPNGGAWSEDGRIIIGSAASGVGLLEVPASGGKATPLTSLDSSRGELAHHWPQVLPGGRFLYSIVSTRPENTGVFVASFATPTERTKLIATEGNALPGAALFGTGGDGKDYLLWRRGWEVVAQQFDLSALKLVTEPRPVADPVRVDNSHMHAALAGGVLLYARLPPSRRLTWLDRSGKPLGEAGEPGDYYNFRISPEGSRVALARWNDAKGLDLWVLEAARGVSNRLTSNPGASHLPVWSPDGLKTLFSHGVPPNLYLREASGAGAQQRLTDKQTVLGALDWSRDGRFILYFENGQETQLDLWVLPVAPDGKPTGDPKPYLRTRFREILGRFSPGPAPRWVAYQSDESGRWEVYVQSFPEPGGARRISTGGGQYPQWNANGRELFYVSGDNKLMAVSLRVEADSVEPSAPHELFPMLSEPRGLLQIPYDAAPDGRRFLVQGPDEQRAPALTVVVNWPALLRK